MELPDIPTVLVPGYTPLGALHPVRLHRRAITRLRRGVAVATQHRIRHIIVSGGAVHPEGTPHVEAEEMAAWLQRAGWPAEDIEQEPRARHTHTNLRNAGRLMLERGWSAALIVSDLFQSFYIASPDRSGLRRRTVADLGFWPGTVRRIRPRVTLFEPTADVFRRGPDPLDP